MNRTISLLLSFVMVLGLMVIPAAAASTPTVTVETAADVKAPGELVTLAVSIADNPGFTNFEWTIEYDETRLDFESIDATIPGYPMFN